jgi:hypothetical protein
VVVKYGGGGCLWGGLDEGTMRGERLLSGMILFYGGSVPFLLSLNKYLSVPFLLSLDK